MSMLPVTYRLNSKTWMCHDIYKDRLKDFDYKFHSEQRKILLLMDTAVSHTQDQTQAQGIHLTNIKSRYLPLNTTAYLQPFDAGIINNFKV